ncbi:MAG: MqnA/MqnD/SBP family protein, partial [Archaeoglobaceae archaeon]
MRFRVAHTPDADDAFMFYAMLNQRIPLSFEVESVVEDIETLNRNAMQGIYDVTAISVHAYAYVHNFYRILSTGASVGN